MIRICLLFLVLSSSALAQTEQNNRAKISAIGMGNVTVFPNACQITISFSHVKPTLREAINENQKTTNDVLKIVRKYVADTLDIKTSLIATNKATRWDQKQEKEVFIGFASSQKLIFILKDLKRLQDFTEELMQTKFNKIEKISYFHTDANEYLKKAQELAVIDAMDTTKRLAKASEVKTGSVIYIQSSKSPNDSSGTRVESTPFEAYGKGMGGKGVSSSGDLINYTVSVTMYTEIIP